MKCLLLVVLACIILGCSSSNKTTETPKSDPYTDFLNATASKRQECLDHKSSVLTPAVFEDEEAIKKNQNPWRFVKDETTANSFLDKFDVNKLMIKENNEGYAVVVKHCSDLSSDMRKDYTPPECSTTFATYEYFKGLIYSTQHYSWSATTKSRARDLMLKFMQYVSESNAAIIDVLLVNDLLKQMSEAKLIKKPTLKEIRIHTEHSKKLSEELRNQFKEMKPLQGCGRYTQFYEEEKIKVSKLLLKLNELIKKAK